MIQELINRLDAMFPGVAIYMDSTPQGVSLPAFFVQIVDVSLVREFQGRYWYRVLFSVVYVPEKRKDPGHPGMFLPLDSGGMLKLSGTLDEMLWLLEEWSPTRRATEIEGRIVDEAAQVEVGYLQMMRKKLPREAYMETLRQEFRTNRR